MLGPTAHIDTFTRDNLPPADQWPEFLLDGFNYPEHLNAAVELTDAMVDRGFGDSVALIGNGRQRTYKELADWTNRLKKKHKPFKTLTLMLGQQPGHGRLLAGCDQGRGGCGQYHAHAARGGIVGHC